MKKLILTLVLFGITGIQGQEIVTLTTPVAATRSSYHLAQLNADFDTGNLQIVLRDNTNTSTIVCSYNSLTSPTGATLNTALQKANLSTAYAANATTGSLKQRVYHRLVVMGEATTICGTPIVGSLTGSVP